MKDIIMENTAEDDFTPESPGTKPRQTKHDRQESFKTHDFASIDSFVQFENQLAVRGQSFVDETCINFDVSKSNAVEQDEIVTAGPFDQQQEYEISGANNGGSNMIDEEQEQIDEELRILRQ